LQLWLKEFSLETNLIQFSLLDAALEKTPNHQNLFRFSTQLFNITTSQRAKLIKGGRLTKGTGEDAAADAAATVFCTTIVASFRTKSKSLQLSPHKNASLTYP
jgi:hypothetical protein